MKKRLLIIALTMISAIVLSSCISVEGTQSASPTSEMTPAQTASAQQAPSLTEAATAEESEAFITAMSMRMDGQTDITFDFIDWLSGGEAEKKYLEDNPGATEEDMEAEGIYEMGYIRNISNDLRIFHTTSGTKYFLPDPMDMSINVEVSYDEFRDSMFPAVDSGINEYLTFVHVRFKGEEILSIEWLYTP